MARSLGLDPLDLIAAVAREGLGGEGSGGPGLARARPSRPGIAGAVSEASIAGLFPGSARPARLAMAAGLLQVLDHWEASHAAAQEADDLGERVASTYWHMIAHRREPDPGNALYWARRVGRHPILGAVGEAARPLLDEHGDAPLAARLVVGGAWSPSAMIDLVGRVREGSEAAALARRLQRLEMIELLGATAAALA